VVELVVVGHNHTLHTYAIDILHIRDDLHENGNTTLMHVIKEQNMCANFMVKEGSHSKCSSH
jgi:hypothetical protein